MPAGPYLVTFHATELQGHERTLRQLSKHKRDVFPRELPNAEDIIGLYFEQNWQPHAVKSGIALDATAIAEHPLRSQLQAIAEHPRFRPQTLADLGLTWWLMAFFILLGILLTICLLLFQPRF